MGSMGLTIVTGPANSAKAEVVLERYRLALARGPILVVPRAADVEHYRRELAAAGRGARRARRAVRRPDARDRAARRRGRASRSASTARERVLESVVARTPLELLAPAVAGARLRRGARAASSPSSGMRRVTPARLGSALRGVGGRVGAACALRRRADGALRRLPPRARADRTARPRAARDPRARRAAPRAARAGVARPCSATASTTSTRCSWTRSRRSRTTSARR